MMQRHFRDSEGEIWGRGCFKVAADSRLPKSGNVPGSFMAFMMEAGGGPGPYGAKGMDEDGILAVTPAVCNAIYPATGMRVPHAPCIAQKIWRESNRSGT